MDTVATKIQVFLSYAREDREDVEKLYQHLSNAGYKPWMDTMDILPGEVWMESIRSAIEKSDFFLVCLSSKSINKRGVLQKEFKSALDVWEGMFESDIYLIPVRLEECAVPHSMAKFQWVDIYEKDGFTRLVRAIQEGVERRFSADSSLTQPPLSTKTSKIQEPPIRNILRESIQPSKKRKIPFWGSIALIVVVALGLPLIINNYFYKVKRPILPETCKIPLQPVRVGISRLTGCSLPFENELAAYWSVNNVDSSIIPGDPSRQPTNYDILISGTCTSLDGKEMMNLTFKLITSRNPYSVYEPSNIQISGGFADLSSVGLALMHYQHGEYTEAINLFESLPKSINSSALNFIEANSLLFSGQYKAAIKSFEEIVRSKDVNSAAASNNMGVAYFNLNDDLALDQFTSAIDLADSQKKFDVEGLARVNRSQYYRVKSEWPEAYKDCNEARGVYSESALPNLCLASYYFTYHNYGSVIAPLPYIEIDRRLNEAELYQDVPPLIHYLRGAWYESHFWKRKQDAVNSYSSYVVGMEYQVCLQIDRSLVDFAKDAIKELTYP